MASSPARPDAERLTVARTAAECKSRHADGAVVVRLDRGAAMDYGSAAKQRSPDDARASGRRSGAASAVFSRISLRSCGLRTTIVGDAMLAYTAPSTVEEAVSALAEASGIAKVLSGGTDLLVQLRSGRAKPDLIVDIKKIPDMSGITERDGGFAIGAATSGAEIGESEALRRAWPGVVEAANLIGSTQIQGRATLAGNLCNASPAADSVPALIAARATCVVAGANGRREVPVESIVTGPGRTSLGRDELVVEFHLPKPPPRSADAYLRFIPRSEMDIAVVGAAVSITLDAFGACTDARIVLGAVAPTA